MKKAIKISLAALLAVCSTSLYAQKFGRINYSDIVQNMPEMESVKAQMETITKEYEEHLESLQVEFNNKVNDLQKPGVSESVKQLKTREAQDLQERLQQYYQVAQEEIEKSQMELLTPLETKANEAIKKVAKAEGLTVVFQVGSVVYIDEATTVDISDKVKKELGITATAATAAATTPAADPAPKK